MASLRSGGGTSAPIGSIGARAGEKPSGEHVDEMVGPGAWPDTHESVFTDRATQLNEKLSALRGALEGWGTHQASIFNGPHVWSGVGASAAGGKVESNAQAMRNHEQQLQDAISWCNEAAGHIGTAKQSITENVNAGIDEINQTLGAASQSDKDPTAAIDAIVQRKYGENVATLGNAAKLLDFKGEVPAAPPRKPGDSGPNEPSDDSPKPDSLSLFGRPGAGGKGPGFEPQPASPQPGTVPAAGVGRPDTGGEGPVYQPVPAVALPPTVQAPAAKAPIANVPSAGSPAPSPGGSSGVPSVPGIGSPGGPSGGGAPSPLSSGSSPSVSPAAFDPSQAAAAAGPQTAGAAPQTPAQAFGQGLANAGPPVQAASAPPVSPTAPPVSAPITDQSAPVAPPSSLPSAPGGPVGGGQAPPAAPVGGGPMMGGPVAPSMPLGPPSTPPPAAPLPPVSPAGLGTPVAPINPNAAAIAGAAIPVSVARAERDAIARSMRRAPGNDPAQVARRIAAALNAEPSVDFGFYWMTALAADGTIVVANSYGIGYIPEGVNLPEQVKVASADESISPADRGRWATYPLLTLQGWAQHHAVGLRQVIATEAQFKGFDAGAARITLQPDDIPESGQMQGRSRLEVIAPAAAATLAAVSDSRLSELLPVAQTDVNPPADETFNKWFDVMKPMMSESPERGQAHLRAFVDYADHAQEKYLFMAHNAVDATAQRAAIADWVYWQHLSVLMSDALVGLQPA